MCDDEFFSLIWLSMYQVHPTRPVLALSASVSFPASAFVAFLFSISPSFPAGESLDSLPL